jgi:hypothetical protein
MKQPSMSSVPTAVDDMMKLADEADHGDRYVVERADGLLLYGSNDLSMARSVFAVWKERRPYGHYLLRRSVEVLERWPPDQTEVSKEN